MLNVRIGSLGVSLRERDESTSASGRCVNRTSEGAAWCLRAAWHAAELAGRMWSQGEDIVIDLKLYM